MLSIICVFFLLIDIQRILRKKFIASICKFYLKRLFLRLMIYLSNKTVLLYLETSLNMLIFFCYIILSLSLQKTLNLLQVVKMRIFLKLKSAGSQKSHSDNWKMKWLTSAFLLLMTYFEKTSGQQTLSVNNEV